MPPTQPSTAAATGLTVQEAVPHFDLHLQARALSPATREVYAAAATLFDRYLAGKGMPRVVTAIRREHIEAWLADMRERGASDGALSNRYRSLRQLFRWLEEDDEIPVSPMAKMKTPKVVVQPPPVLTAEQFSRLHKLAGQTGANELERRRNLALVAVLAGTGMRRAELLNLTLDDVDLTNHRLRVYRGKGGKTRVVGLDPKPTQALSRYMRVRSRSPHAGKQLRDERKRPRGEALWLGRQGPLGETGLRELLHKLGRGIGVPELHPHQLRHTYAHLWLSAEGSETGLMQAAGWSDRSMLQRYGKSAAGERSLAEAERLGIGDRW